MSEDRVNHPKHYTSHPSGVECIEITEHYNFTVGNAIKYLWRCGLKEEEGMDAVEKQVQDLKKSIWYINREIKNLEEGVYNGKNKQKQNEDVEENRDWASEANPYASYTTSSTLETDGSIRNYSLNSEPLLTSSGGTICIKTGQH